MSLSKKRRKSFRRQASCLAAFLKSNETLLRNRILSSYLHHYTRITGDQKPLGLLRSQRYDLLYAYVDSLGVEHPNSKVFFAVSQLQHLIKKYPWTSSEVPLDPEAAALTSFHQSEEKCSLVNQTIRDLRSAHRLPPFMENCRRYIEYVIGFEPDVDSCMDLCDFSAGASIGVHGAATHIGRKLSVRDFTVGPACVPYVARAVMRHHQLACAFRNDDFVTVSSAGNLPTYLRVAYTSYNKIGFVPKTAKTHRSIAVEPLGNGLVQKGIDQYLRLRLKRVGIDLSDQSRNQRMARQGSLDDRLPEGYVTLDLKAASDSIALEVVRTLLPEAWFSFLNCCRSPEYVLPCGAKKRYEKFVSMGNGFCFPLETLIFASVLSQHGKAGVDWSVYGDDIIVRKNVGEIVVGQLEELGFTLNQDKSFLKGPFRESCGADWFEGEDVRPFVWDFRLRTVSDCYKFLNLTRRSRLTTGYLNEAREELLKIMPDEVKLIRPFKGNPDTAIDPLDITEVRFTRMPRWLEWHACPVKDKRDYPPWAVTYAMLRGASSDSMFTFRRKTKNRLRSVAGWCSTFEHHRPISLVRDRVLGLFGLTS